MQAPSGSPVGPLADVCQHFTHPVKHSAVGYLNARLDSLQDKFASCRCCIGLKAASVMRAFGRLSKAAARPARLGRCCKHCWGSPTGSTQVLQLLCVVNAQ